MAKPISGLTLAEPRLAVAVLAAGASRRFGETDKLIAPFRGRPLGLHAPDAIPGEIFAHRWVIVSDPEHVLVPAWADAGFVAVHNPDAARGLGTSVALAAREARAAGCDALLIALADMPMVPREHYAALIAAWDGPLAIIASNAGADRLPPAIFGSAHFERLSHSRGDEGARRWLGEARAIECPHDWLDDIDTSGDLSEHGHVPPTTPKPDPKGEDC